MTDSSHPNDPSPTGIAIIGMAGRFPKAKNLAQFWDNLKNGVEGLRLLTDEELAAVEPDYDEMKADPDYVPGTGVLDDVELFDAGFFGMKPREAKSMDPQQRIWLETAWECMENAGYAPGKTDSAVGVYTGSFMNSYLFYNLSPDRETIEGFVRLQSLDSFMHMITNERDYLPTRTSYLFDLTGPAINVQTACSTSLVAISLACQSLLNYESDMALAGGVTIFLPQERGYFYVEGGMRSSDGHCRPFDAKASGTVFASGVGCVMLKRVEDAIEDGDNILAVIKGTALNNDGTHKASYTAPSIDGQAEVIAMAQAIAEVDPETISYVEAHGTATPMGDPIEVAALTQAFRQKTDKNQFVALGAVKSNIGHLDAASGVAGVIKTVLALQNEAIPPTLHYENANPEIDFANSPFYVADKLLPWPKSGAPRRAGVSSFGVGGTNAHAVLEEAPEIEPSGDSRPRQLFMLSGRSESVLTNQATQLADALEQQPDVLADVAFTLNQGRTDFAHRRAVVAADAAEAIERLRDPKAGATGKLEAGEPSTVFMFPGQGSQFVGMGLELYENEPVFKDAVDQCAEYLTPHLGLDLREILYPADLTSQSEAAAEKIKQTRYAQPTIFTVSYALAELWQSWGIAPDAMVGHSVGEFVAAAQAGIFSLEDALMIIAERGRLMQELPGGSMRAVRMTLEELQPYLGDGVSLAANNAPAICVVSGNDDAIARFDAKMEAQGLDTILLHTSHAFHSDMMEPILEPFRSLVAGMVRQAPEIPIVSTLTGTWMTDNEATDPEYWVRQLRNAVRFSDAVKTLQEEPGRILLEVGPGKALTNAALQHPNPAARQTVIDSLGHPKKKRPALEALLEALGRMWIAGADIDWDAYWGDEFRRRVALPTYPFERQRYWIDPPALNSQTESQVPAAAPAPAFDSTPEPAKSQSQIEGERRMSRQKNIADAVAKMMQDLSGIEIASSEYETSFMEMGYDSLTLTQVSTLLKKQMKVNVRFRKLLEDLSTIDSLAAHLAKELPADKYADPEPAAEPAQAAPPPAQAAPPPQQQMPQQPQMPMQGGMPQMPQQMPQMPQMPQQMPGFQQPQMPMGNMGMMNPMQMQMQMMQQMWQQFQQQMALMMGGYGMMPGQMQMPQMPGYPQQMPQPEPQIVEKIVEKVVEVETGPKRPKAPEKKEGDEVSRVRFGPYKKIKKEKGGALTPAQQAHLDALVERMVAKTGSSKAHAQKYRDVQADPRTVAGFRQTWKDLVYQIVTERSKGSRVWDIDGNEYVDITTGFGIGFLGHSPDFVMEAIQEQLERGLEIGPQMKLAGEVARLVREITGNERVSFCNTGSEALTAAVRMARTYSGRDKIVYFSGDYHGVFDEVLARPQVINGELHTLPATPGITEESVANAYIIDYGTQASLDFIRANAEDIAAVVIEPIQSRHPENRPRDFIHEIRKITAENDIAMVFDEVITGFRVALGGAKQYYEVEPDICCYGKIIGGGIPIGVVAGARKYMDGIDGGWWQYGDDSLPEADLTFFAGTFVRHPMAMASAYAVLTFLKKQGERLQEWMNERTAMFATEMNEFFEERQVPIKINHFSSWFRVEVPTNYAYPDLIFYHLIDNGVYVFTFAQNCFFSIAHTDDDIEFIKNAFKKTVVDLQAGGFLPPPPAGVTDPFPLADSQEEIFIAAQLGETAANAYTDSFSLHLRGDVHPAALRQAAQVVISRHDALHMTFSPEGDWQKRLTDIKVDVPVVDLTHVPAEEQAEEVAQTLDAAMRTPFDYTNGKLYTTQLIKLADDEYVYQFAADHIAYDGWSAVVVIDEIRECYNAFVQGLQPTLERPDSLREYVQWEREESSGEDGARIVNYWKSRYETLPPPLELPADRKRPAARTFEGTSVHYTFNPKILNNLKSLSKRSGVSTFVLLLSAYYTLLYRLSGKTDIAIGVPSAGQALAGTPNLVGQAVNTLPIRVQFESDMRFAELTNVVKAMLLDGQDHQPFSTGALFRHIEYNRDPSRPPVVEVSFNLDRKVPDEPFHNLETTIREVPIVGLIWDIFCNLYEEGDALKADCHYNTDIFEGETILNWMSYFDTLLQEIVKDVTLPLAEIPMMRETETEQVLREWNNTAVEIEQLPTPELIVQKAKSSPKRVAVRFKDQKLSYHELDRRSNQLARYLNKQGVEENSLVGVLMDRSAEMVVALLGVWKAGGAYVPLDPTYPNARLAHMIEDSGLGWILTETGLTGDMPKHDKQVLVWEEIAADVAEESTRKLNLNFDPESRAYVIYTSGSTGLPKGVQVPHRSLTNFLWSMRSAPGLTPKDKLVSVTTLSFDIHALEIWLPLMTGSTLIVASVIEATDGERLAELLDDSKATVMQATPATWKLLLESGWSGRSGMKMLCGGEPLPNHLADELLEKGGELWNMYGPTETTIWSSIAQIRPDDELITIGRPIANTQMYVLNDALEPLPVGMPGELFIGGDGVTLGYLNRPELTAERFIDNPFTDGMMYRTGDIAKYTRDGRLVCLGRVDHQVKVRGFRIELGEIETRLIANEAVKDAAVIVREDTPDDKRIVAYMVGTETEAADLRQFLSKSLPHYMLPSNYVWLDALPLTNNGKIDRKALPAPDYAHPATAKSFIAPRDEIEEAVSEIWKDQLNIQRMSMNDDFFDLGAHSIIAVRVMSRIRNKLGVDMPLADLFDHSTTETLARHITALQLLGDDQIFSTTGEEEEIEEFEF